MRNQKDFSFDYALRLKDAGAITSSAAAQVDGAGAVLDLGDARVDGRVIVDVSAIDVSSADEKYELEAQFSNSSSFGSGNVVGSLLKLGDSSTTGSSGDSVVGRYELGVTNEINGTIYRYMRMYTRVAGTSPSINYTANLVQDA